MSVSLLKRKRKPQDTHLLSFLLSSFLSTYLVTEEHPTHRLLALGTQCHFFTGSQWQAQCKFSIFGHRTSDIVSARGWPTPFLSQWASQAISLSLSHSSTLCQLGHPAHTCPSWSLKGPTANGKCAVFSLFLSSSVSHTCQCWLTRLLTLQPTPASVCSWSVSSRKYYGTHLDF